MVICGHVGSTTANSVYKLKVLQLTATLIDSVVVMVMMANKKRREMCVPIHVINVEKILGINGIIFNSSSEKRLKETFSSSNTQIFN